MTTIAKQFAFKKQAARFSMDKKQLSKVSFQQLASWLKEDMDLLFVGLTKDKMVTKLHGFYLRLKNQKVKSISKPKATTKRKAA